MLDSIYHMTLKLLKNLWRENVKIMLFLMQYIAGHYVTKYVNY